MGQLWNLRRSLRGTVLGSLDVWLPGYQSEMELIQIARDKIRPPIAVAYLGLASGVHISYPYRGGFDPGYDSRNRSWYLQALEAPAEEKEEVVWSPPYTDAVRGHEGVVTCSVAVRDRKGKFRGAAAIDVYVGEFQKILERMGNRGSYISGKYLLDDHGRVFIESPGRETAEVDDIEFAEFGRPKVVESMLEKRNGWMFNTEDGKLYLYFFYHIEVLKWYYVERIDFNQLIESMRSQTDEKQSKVVK